MGAAETGMPTVMGFQGVDDGIGSEPVGRQPSGGHGEGRTQEKEDAADRRKAQENGPDGAHHGSTSGVSKRGRRAAGVAGDAARRAGVNHGGKFTPEEKAVLKRGRRAAGGGRGAPPGAQA